jgi:hypothetical protein
MGSKGEISKTHGGYTIAEMRGNGYSASDIISLLAKACLAFPAMGWELHNLKPDPRVNL